MRHKATGPVQAAVPLTGVMAAMDRPLGQDEALVHLDDKCRDVLTFSIGGEQYALGIDSIREIIKCRPVTEVPRVPAFVAGIIAVRGVVMPVIDLRLRLRLPALPLSPKARILVVMRHGGDPARQDGPPEPFGLIVDCVYHVVQLSEYDIEPPTMLGGHESDFVSGIGRLPGLSGGAGMGESGPARPSAGTGIIPTQKRPMLILLDLPRVLSFEHAGSQGPSHGAGHHLQEALLPSSKIPGRRDRVL